MQLHPRTIETLKELDAAEWFSAVGSEEATDSVLVVSSWSEAIRSCSAPEWEGLLLEAANQYRERLQERSPDELASWNARVRIVKEATIPLVEKKVRKVARTNDLPQVFLDTVNWDILHICMEAEFAHVHPPGFYASQAYWYVKGHFPCGWQGRFPGGQLVVY